MPMESMEVERQLVTVAVGKVQEVCRRGFREM